MQMTLLGLARVWSNALNRHFGTCPKTDMPARHSTWEPQQACVCSSECAYTMILDSPCAGGPHKLSVAALG
jgi:hypothetical protein